ncbi:hypothetical protein KV102_16270 [Mumia sp. zg.B53]|uniref:hypothetical protein n=1 Tax=unclassified Mumia TaxID=2621872 RepID=UPI001C6E9988|nr:MULTISPECIES: hypothetical protein [unclassified Mumia]MBW9208438.1 hypothetical protein [Mumia sp. zg.B21]MBW9216395.1 hypothetical protein [Mumia sp. zg.B53]
MRTARKLGILLALLATLTFAGGFWAPTQAADEPASGLSATVSPGTAGYADRVKVKGVGWPAMTQVQAVVCGDLAIGGSSACDQGTAVLGVANVDGEVDLDLVVGNPPRPCPCVVRLASYTGPALAVDSPLVITGHPTGTPPTPVLPLPNLHVKEVRLEGSGGFWGLFGAAPARKLVVTIENRGTAPAVNPPIKIGVGQSAETEPTVGVGRDLTIQPLQSSRLEMNVELPFAAFGTYHVVGSVGEGDLGTTFETTWGAYPWALIAFTIMCAALLALGIYVRLKAAQERRKARMPGESAAALASKPYGLPDVVYVESLGGFLVSPKAVGKTRLINRLDGRLEGPDLVALLGDPGLASQTRVLSGTAADGGGGGAAVVDLPSLDAWLTRRDPSGAPSGDDPAAPVSADAVVDVDAVDTWLAHREGKRSSQTT